MTRGFLVAVISVSAACGLAHTQTRPPDTAPSLPASLPYYIVDTGQRTIFSDKGQLLKAPKPGEPFFGQDGFYASTQPAYRDNTDGTISDLNTGLMWVKARGEKTTWEAAAAGAADCRVGGYRDWRMPSIKELYSLINFNGACRMIEGEADSTPYIDTKFFDFKYGEPSKGERIIDCQDWSATTYVGLTMNGNPTAFGVNFADGRIKGYGKTVPRGAMKLYARYVRGNADYGNNDFHDNGDGTISDRATGMMWTKADSGKGMNWTDALAWAAARNKERFAGHNDWRLPNAKELQSIVDYTRGPEAKDARKRGAAIDPIFQISRLSDGEYPFFWSSTTHLDGQPDRQGQAAVYVTFGRALGWMQFPPGRGEYKLYDVHGAGAQRSDPKIGDPKGFLHGRGPQGDVVRISNYVRLVRSIDTTMNRPVEPDLRPLPVPSRSPGRELPDRQGPPRGDMPAQF